MANLYRPAMRNEAEVVIIDPANGSDFQLEELYRILECRTIEIVPLRHSQRIMIIDEEGKLGREPKPYNNAASLIAKLEHSIQDDDCIVGHALVCRKGELL